MSENISFRRSYSAPSFFNEASQLRQNLRSQERQNISTAARQLIRTVSSKVFSRENQTPQSLSNSRISPSNKTFEISAKLLFSYPFEKIKHFFSKAELFYSRFSLTINATMVDLPKNFNDLSFSNFIEILEKNLNIESKMTGEEQVALFEKVKFSEETYDELREIVFNYNAFSQFLNFERLSLSEKSETSAVGKKFAEWIKKQRFPAKIDRQQTIDMFSKKVSWNEIYDKLPILSYLNGVFLTFGELELRTSAISQQVKHHLTDDVYVRQTLLESPAFFIHNSQSEIAIFYQKHLVVTRSTSDGERPLAIFLASVKFLEKKQQVQLHLEFSDLKVHYDVSNVEKQKIISMFNNLK